MRTEINIRNRDKRLPGGLVEAAGGDELIARIFYNRGFTDPDTVKQMLDSSCYIPTTPEEFPDMGRAVEIITLAIKEKKKIAVYGDYDVDGVTSTVTLVQCLGEFTQDLLYHVPDRFTEGYGMNGEVVKALADKGVKLVITCDCGISNFEEIKLAKELGMDVVITDHHTPPDRLPPADAVLNPKFLGKDHKAKEIPGCGMAYFLSLALLKHFGGGEKAELCLDMLAMALVADVVKLEGETRYLLRKALPRLFGSGRPGLKALFAVIGSGSTLGNEEDIAFQLAPRINAAGRMDSARLPVELFLSEDMNLALPLAKSIDGLNKERKRLQQEIIKQAEEMAEAGKKNNAVLVLYNQFWHHGIIGIAAGKISETYHKPVILLSLKEDGETIVGSARSIEEVNIYELIKECSGKLLKFGGHAAAAGLSMKKEDLPVFTREIELLAQKKYFIKEQRRIDADLELDLEQINDELHDRLTAAGPYGEGFERPLFYTGSVAAASDRKTGNNHHIMVLAGQKGSTVHAVQWFGEDKNHEGKVFDIAYSIKKSTYGGNSQLQLTVEHMLPAAGKYPAVFRGEFVDARNMEVHSILHQYRDKDLSIFYEGLKSLCTIEGVKDRYGIGKAETLMFLSPPVNSRLFKEVILLANPARVVINFSIGADYTFKGFLFNFFGVLKYTITRDSGYAYLEDLAIRMGVEEGIIKAALKYLKFLGKIDYILDGEEERVLVLTGSGKADVTLSRAEKNLKNALEEKSAYRQFLMQLDIGRFKEYMK